MLWRTFGRITLAGMVLGAICGALYILLQAVAGFAQHPDPRGIPAALVLAYVAAWWGGISGVPLGLLNGLLVVVVALSIQGVTREHPPGERGFLIGVGVAAVAVNLLAVRAVVNFWFSDGTFTFAQFPPVFAFLSAVLVDLWAARILYRGPFLQIA